MFCTYCLVMFFYLTFINLGGAGEFPSDAPGGEVFLETPEATNFKRGAGDVADHLAA